ncbi:hypothetical protein [Dactylosporangium sp. NBC_01737]|uniref:hypothetical protein n=1 Tax=Dactylosporangium sp. NBC_01737 TaxID=2975959 RepID=UPI003FA3461E
MTVLNYRSIVERYLVPRLGWHRLSKLSTRDVQRAMDVIMRERVRGGRLISPASVHRIRAVLRSALSEARRQGMIGRNAARGAAAGRVPGARGRVGRRADRGVAGERGKAPGGGVGSAGAGSVPEGGAR